MCTVTFANTNAIGEAVEVILGELVGWDDVVEDSIGKIVEMHAVCGHFVEEVFFFCSDEAVAFAAQFHIE